MMIKRNTIKQDIDIVAEKTEKKTDSNSSKTIKCHICNRVIDEKKLPVSCSKEECPFV